jgi:hypothetical protein
MTYDTLTYNGVEKSFVDWGFGSSVNGRKVNQGADEFTATIVNKDLASEQTSPTFPFEAQVIVRTARISADGSSNSFSGGVIKFAGKRVGQPMKAGSNGQNVTYKFKSAWYDLENTHYQQAYKGGATGGSIQFVLPETVLFSYAQNYTLSGQELYYGNISAGDQIQAILEWLLIQHRLAGYAAPFQFSGSTHYTGGTGGWSHSDGTPVNGTGVATASGVFYHWTLAGTPTISASLYSLWLPTLITKPLMCSDALQKCLELAPRANIWFDYSTTPPTLHVTQKDDKVPKTFALFDGVSHKSLSIQRRDDLLVRGVNITYRISGTFDGASQVSYALDNCDAAGLNSNNPPLTNGLRVVNELIDLQGNNVTTIKATVDTEPVQFWSQNGSYVGTGYTNGTAADHAAKRIWWSWTRGGEDSKLIGLSTRFQYYDPAATDGSVLPVYLNDATVTGEDGTIYSAADLLAAGFKDAAGNLVINRVVEGTTADWMTRGDGQPVVTKKVRVSVQTTFIRYDISGTSETDVTSVSGKAVHSGSHPKAETLTANIVITNAPSGNYAAIATTESSGEAYVVGSGGIAQYLYNHLNEYQYDGDAVMVQAAFDGTGASAITMGNVLNLSGGADEWRTMNAQIQAIEEDYFNHTTTVQIGVAKHLNAGQLSSILNMWRFRRNWYNPALRNNPNAGGASNQIAKSTGQSNTVATPPADGRQQHIDYTTPPNLTTNTAGVLGGVLNHDPKLITQTLAATTPTPIAGHTDETIRTMQPRECKLCDADGNEFYALVHCGGGYTKPA